MDVRASLFCAERHKTFGGALFLAERISVFHTNLLSHCKQCSLPCAPNAHGINSEFVAVRDNLLCKENLVRLFRDDRRRVSRYARWGEHGKISNFIRLFSFFYRKPVRVKSFNSRNIVRMLSDALKPFLTGITHGRTL